MLTYQEYEKAVFEWLLTKRQSDPSFNFSIRKKASKGAENDFFIGTEKSKYFATTFWIVPVSFPGSSADLINLVFEWKEDKYLYKFQFQQPKEVEGTQNQLALRLIRNIKPRIRQADKLRWESPERHKAEIFITKSRQPSYASVEEMMPDVFADYELISPIIEEEIANLEHRNPEFEGWKIQAEHFEKSIQGFEIRKSKYANLPLETRGLSDPTTKKNETEKSIKSTSAPLNQILYGPPGTGKTYHTINKAIEIIEPDFNLQQERQIVKEKFDALQEAGQIVFTTFHQSMSYEDFVEGIKPLKPEDTDTFVRYDVRPGIFKTICEKAKAKSIVSNNFENAYASLLREIKANNGSLVLETLVHAKEFTIYENSRGNLKFHANTEKAYEGVILKDVIREFLQSGNALDWPSYTKAVAKHLEEHHRYSQTEKEEVKSYVLIIDEINRGNVSQIFGELITLLEPDKRWGNDEGMEVKLPYSKDSFSVPPNLYLIGTMNTADRSVEALDTALRRRFSFIEMPPKKALLTPSAMFWRLLKRYKKEDWDDPVYEEKEAQLMKLLGADDWVEDNKVSYWKQYKKTGIEPEFHAEHFKGIHLNDLLGVINRRIEKLLDKDHFIGHSYFLNVGSLRELKDTFYRNIIPLLQEYFFGDFGKIGLVLGSGFVKKADDSKVEFADFSEYTDRGELEERPIYRIVKESDMNEENFKSALALLKPQS